jgi:hypothetical protein
VLGPGLGDLVGKGVCVAAGRQPDDPPPPGMGPHDINSLTAN